MKITTHRLSWKDTDPDFRKKGKFLQLSADKEDESNILVHDNHIYELPHHIALGVSVLLDYYNGENEDNDGSKYPEVYKKWFDRDMLGDCHNLAWTIGTASVDIGNNSFLEESDMAMAGYQVAMKIKSIAYDRSISGYMINITTPETEESTILPIKEFETKLSMGDIVMLYYVGYHCSCHSFMYMGQSKEGEGMYIQRLGRGGHIVISSFKESCAYYDKFLSGNQLAVRSCVYSNNEK